MPSPDLSIYINSYGGSYAGANAVAEILLYDVALTDPQKQLLRTDLSRRWGTPLP